MRKTNAGLKTNDARNIPSNVDSLSSHEKQPMVYIFSNA